MDSTRWIRIQALFHDAADLPAHEQRAFLNSACAGDVELIADVLGLLEEDARGGSLLDSDMAHVAHDMLDEGVAPAATAKEFGPYRVKRVLGEGGMGVVYLAERTDLGSLVAIKILRDAWLSPARRERFSTEQRTLAQLNHPSIARLYDADTMPDGTPFFVMEYVEGLPLTEYCRHHKSSIGDRLHLFRSVCEAVVYAHQHAVIHRDLKPSNILVREDGAVRLVDFGIAKHLETLGQSAEQKIDQTMTGLRLMTPAYAAPEQVRGEQAGIQSDVYSLGVILYELLSGRLPFDLSSRTPAQAEKILSEQEPEKPSAVAAKNAASPQGAGQTPFAGKTAWSDLDVLCLTAMHKDPQRRYRSVEALIRDVDHFLGGQPLEARPDTVGYRLGKFVRRNRRSVAAAALVCAAIVGLVIVYTVRLARARNVALAEAARTQRVQKFMLDLFQGGDEDAGPAADLRVVTLLDRGVKQARSLAGEPEVQADLYETLANTYQQLGKMDEADSLFTEALNARKLLFGADSARVAETLVDQSLLRADQGQYDEAERLARDGLEMSRRHLPPNHPAVARAQSNVGRIMVDRGQFKVAIPILEQALRLQNAQGKVSSDLSSTLTELANCHFYLGDYAESDALNHRVLDMDRQLLGDRHPNVAEDYINLAAIQFEQGHFPEAEKYDRQALEIIQAWFGRDHPETSSILTILARVLTAQGKLDEAVALLRESLTIQERAYGNAHPRVASTVSELGKVALEQGKLNEAEADFNRAEAIWTKAYDGKHHYIANVLANLGGVYMERRQYTRAESYFRDALAMYALTLPPGHQQAGIARVRLGRALLRQHLYADAEAESRAGEEILARQSNPPAKWLRDARQDLAEESAALH
jgi:serine/threonine protein kinase/tetratricopeptide (TPR) repeat protein